MKKIILIVICALLVLPVLGADPIEANPALLAPSALSFDGDAALIAYYRAEHGQAEKQLILDIVKSCAFFVMYLVLVSPYLKTNEETTQ